jgi:hypothetical protein
VGAAGHHPEHLNGRPHAETRRRGENNEKKLHREPQSHREEKRFSLWLCGSV